MTELIGANTSRELATQSLDSFFDDSRRISAPNGQRQQDPSTVGRIAPAFDVAKIHKGLHQLAYCLLGDAHTLDELASRLIAFAESVHRPESLLGKLGMT